MAPEVFAGSFARSPGDRKFHATQSAPSVRLAFPGCCGQESFTGLVAAASQFHGRFHGRGPVEVSLPSGPTLMPRMAGYGSTPN